VKNELSTAGLIAMAIPMEIGYVNTGNGNTTKENKKEQFVICSLYLVTTRADYRSES
jgi:hypothetical protein